MLFCWLSDSKKLVWRPQKLVHKSAHNAVILMMFWSAEASILTAFVEFWNFPFTSYSTQRKQRRFGGVYGRRNLRIHFTNSMIEPNGQYEEIQKWNYQNTSKHTARWLIVPFVPRSNVYLDPLNFESTQNLKITALFCPQSSVGGPKTPFVATKRSYSR